MSAFLLLSDCVIPVLSFRGAIPVFSVRSPLIKPQNILGFNRLQIHKATGPDKIFSCILKEMAAEVAPILHLFFQASINQGILPTDWKTANLVESIGEV
jgi:hypothetical protein